MERQTNLFFHKDFQEGRNIGQRRGDKCRERNKEEKERKNRKKKQDERNKETEGER